MTLARDQRELDETAEAPAQATAAEPALEQQEHLANVVRLRRGTLVGLVAFVLFAVADWLVAAFIAPGILGELLAIRFATVALIVPPLIRLHVRRAPGRALLRAIDIYVFAAVSVSVSIMSVRFRGIESPYFMGIMMVVICRGAVMSQHWRTSLLPIAVTAFAPTPVVLGAALMSPSIAQQLVTPSALVVFVLYQFFFIASTAAFTLLGGHVVWALRRQLFETRSIGRYRLQRRIGAGGMGEVWRAYHTTLKRDIALKILRPDRDDRQALARFEREVRATALLSHPNTIRVFDYGTTDDGLFYYAMELLDGETLDELVRREGALDCGRASRIVLQVARAIAEAHARNIIHRDIKPANVFLTQAGGEVDFAKVLDFGIARVGEAIGEATITGAGWVGGTPTYISPEVIQGQRGDERSDVYSLGGVLYFLLAARPPFEAERPAAMMAAHLTEPPAPPSAKRGHPVPAELEAIVMRCLAKAPAERLPSARAVAEALSRFLAGAVGGPGIA
jgi:serine/threonine-protein kinase